MPPVTSPLPLAKILPTRVRRNYRGGKLLDALEHKDTRADGDRPESWIASTTPASNPGLPREEGEGLTRLCLRDGVESTLDQHLASDPEFHLGSASATELGFLAKLLDSAMRLHVQAHPTAEFARTRLGAPYGKLEVYYVLATREPWAGYLRLGFQNAPTREEWKRIVETQDIAAMDACFEKIPVRPGDVWLVPGGMPHAIGEGVLMVEIMEPSDLVVRCEYEREGIIVPSAGRFMGKDLDFCLDIFDFTQRTPEEVRRLCQCQSKSLGGGPGWKWDELVGISRTSCFEVQRIRASVSCDMPRDGRCAVVIQTRGHGKLASGYRLENLSFGEACFVSAGATSVTCIPDHDVAEAEWLLCKPARRT